MLAVVVAAASLAVLAGAGWYLCLGGGVLLRGYSDHDLDIIAIPAAWG
jgi:hypothetical protein